MFVVDESGLRDVDMERCTGWKRSGLTSASRTP